MNQTSNLLPLLKRLRILGAALVVAGVVMAGAGMLYGFPQAQDGLDSAQAMYAAQGVTMNYNEEGVLVDRGTPEGAQKILALLEGEWRYPVNHDNFDPKDPIVNTRDELMYQYATITYHVLNSTVAVKLTAQDVPITYRGVTYEEPGTYNMTLGKYYAQLDRGNPIERQLRDAWTPLALSLTGSLAGGHANQAAGELAKMTTLAVAGIGAVFAASGIGLIWATYARAATSAPAGRIVPVPQARAQAAQGEWARHH